MSYGRDYLKEVRWESGLIKDVLFAGDLKTHLRGLEGWI